MSRRPLHIQFQVDRVEIYIAAGQHQPNSESLELTAPLQQRRKHRRGRGFHGLLQLSPELSYRDAGLCVRHGNDRNTVIPQHDKVRSTIVARNPSQIVCGTTLVTRSPCRND